KLKAKLAAALEENDRLRSERPDPLERECPTCQDLMGDLCELRSKYTEQVEEIDGLKAKCGELQFELDKPTLSEEPECENCPH
ncbi:hypothetical protein, partial [Klebsiella pneumoniae]|uniref:hypothetical protein n=1 Tax=Klebsiella pneumoniae TaxID=573 RepID=UPI0024DE111F